eukprot:CAMPEP_0196590592 /NCGR_PEP_ID=MMETSP1081-20130531/67038_1 /TAXON_ID=36882 /ORGANISM="Pyramimonas amylifera, Strain CCMP720" /LENGTH=51 /DNA_ID=CAMNT_0041913743 /DNA_START=165 /DNA_END=320 /DNA_ORIENTATION=+
MTAQQAERRLQGPGAGTSIYAIEDVILRDLVVSARTDHSNGALVPPYFTRP